MSQSGTLQLNIAICDDEPAMQELLEQASRDILREKFELQFFRASTPRELLPQICTCQIAILDVQLAEECGIDLAREILTRNPGCRIIFVSGYLTSVSQVYHVPHFCFILKDHLSEYLPDFLTRAADAVAGEAGQQLVIQLGKKAEALELSGVVYIERNIHQTRIVMSSGREYITKEKLSDLLSRIDAPDFLRCHVSYIVNLRHAAAIEGNCFRMDSGDLVTISRPHEKAAKEAFFQHLWSKT